MRPRRVALAVLCPAVFVAGFAVNGAVAADDPPPPPSQRTLVGVMVDSRDGTTESVINCLGDGRHRTVNGDGTLFMPNLQPHTVICLISIRRVGTSS